MAKRMTKAESGQASGQIRGGLEAIAEGRRELEAAGHPLPAAVRMQINNMRQVLRNQGLPEHVIDATPGLWPL